MRRNVRENRHLAIWHWIAIPGQCRAFPLLSLIMKANGPVSAVIVCQSNPGNKQWGCNWRVTNYSWIFKSKSHSSNRFLLITKWAVVTGVISVEILVYKPTWNAWSGMVFSHTEHCRVTKACTKTKQKIWCFTKQFMYGDKSGWE